MKMNQYQNSKQSRNYCLKESNKLDYSTDLFICVLCLAFVFQTRAIPILLSTSHLRKGPVSQLRSMLCPRSGLRASPACQAFRSSLTFSYTLRSLPGWPICMPYASTFQSNYKNWLFIPAYSFIISSQTYNDHLPLVLIHSPIQQQINLEHLLLLGNVVWCREIKGKRRQSTYLEADSLDGYVRVQ